MKDNKFYSFRLRMLLYILICIFLTLITEAALVSGIFFLRSSTRIEQKKKMESIVSSESPKPEGKKTPPATLQKKQKENYYYKILRNVKEFNTTGIIGFFIFLICLFLLIFMAYFMLITKHYADYLNYIKDGILSVSRGELDNRLVIRGKDEIAVIAEQINVMSGEIQKLMENERTLEKQKNELITSVAHDLRTPLTSILGYQELLLQKENLTLQEQQKYIQITYDKSLRLQHLIEDLFSFTKLDSGELQPKKAPIDMVKLLEQMVEEFYPIFEDNHLVCEWDTTTEKAIVDADGELMARAVENLLSNAVRYGKDGKKIRVHVETKFDSVWISVINYGILIPEESLSHIFERFYRVEASRNEQTGGTGLGLNIVQKIIHLHGGKIYADSGTQGTRFRIVLPLYKEEEEEKNGN